MEVDYKMPFMSHHAPMMVTLRKVDSSGKISFKFFNIWADNEEFVPLVEEVRKT